MSPFRGRVPALVACAVLTTAGFIPISTAAPVAWKERFAAETDTVVFFSTEGLLWKGPFSMAAAETLWAPSGRERLTRVEVSPDGSRVAWITSGSEQDTVRLWTGSSRPSRARAHYFSFLPGSTGRVHFEAGVPTIADEAARGARLVTSSPRLLRAASTPLAWMPDGSAVVFGYSDGVALTPAEQGDAVPAFDLPVVRLLCLDPAALFLAEFAAPPAPGEDPRRSDWHLLFPAPGRWRAFPTEDFREGMPWTASSTTLWWAHGPDVRAAYVHNPERHTAAKMHSNVVGLACERGSETITIVTADEIARLALNGRPQRLASFALPARRMLVDRDSGSVAAVVGDTLLLVQADTVRHVTLKGLDARGMLRSGDRVLFWGVSSGSSRLGMAWLERGQTAVRPIDVPLQKGTIFPAPGSRWMFAARAGGKPPGTLHAYELSSGTWSEVANPGIAGWEPFSSRK